MQLTEKENISQTKRKEEEEEKKSRIQKKLKKVYLSQYFF
jgi:hypothetical protein